MNNDEIVELAAKHLQVVSPYKLNSHRINLILFQD